MNVDRRIVGAAHGPSDDSGSDGEENLRVSRSLKTYEQQLEPGGGLSLKWPSVCKVIPGRINHSKTNVEAGAREHLRCGDNLLQNKFSTIGRFVSRNNTILSLTKWH